MKKLTTEQIKEAQSRFDQLIQYIEIAVGGMVFTRDTLDNFLVADENEVYKGHVSRLFDKNTGVATIKWYPAPDYVSWAPRRRFVYDFTDGVDNTDDGIAWFGKIKSDLGI